MPAIPPFQYQTIALGIRLNAHQFEHPLPLGTRQNSSETGASRDDARTAQRAVLAKVNEEFWLHTQDRRITIFIIYHLYFITYPDAVSWHDARTCFLFAVILYGCSTVYSIFLWRKGFRRHDHVNYCLLLAGMILHTRAMILRGLSLDRCPVNNLYEAMVFVAWTIAAAYLVLGLFPRLRHFGSFVAPIVFAIGVFALMPALDVPYKDKPQFSNGLVSLHAALSLLSYGAFGLSSVAALMYLTLEHDLKFHKLRALLALFPAIDRLEKITSRLLWAGFILLTAGLAFIPFLLRQHPEAHIAADPKVPWSVLVWLLYLALIVLHCRFAQSGRRFAWGAIGTFAFVLLTFWGVNLLSPTHKF